MKFEGIVNFLVGQETISFKVNGEEFQQIKFNSDVLYLKKTECNYSVFFVFEDKTSVKKVICSEHFREKLGSRLDITYQFFIDNLFSLNIDFGIWIDEKKHSIVLVKGIFGLIPIYYYYLPQSFLSFSSSYKSLITSINKQGILLNPDEITIYNYLTRRDWGKSVSARTFFKEIYSVYPGHYLHCTSNTLCQTPYFQFEPEKYHLENTSLEECSHLLKEKLNQSITNLVGENCDGKNIGVQLSGGLDSSAITGILKNLFPQNEIIAFFLQASLMRNKDTEFAELVANYVNAELVIIKHSDTIINMFKNVIKDGGMPSRLVSGGIPGTLIREEAMKLNVDTLLSGQGGDEIIGYGDKYLHQLFENNNWKEIKEICKEIASRKNKDSNYDTNIVFNHIVFSLLRKDKRILSTLKKLISIGSFHTFKYYIEQVSTLLFKGRRTRRLSESVFLNADFIKTIDLESLDDGYLDSRLLVTKSGIDFSATYSSLFINIVESFFNLNEQYASKIYLPFLEKDVYELSMAIPNKIKFANGLKRGHLREAIRDLVPEEVRLRSDKFIFVEFVRSIGLKMHSNSEALLNRNQKVWQYANYDFYKDSIALLERIEDGDDMEMIRRNTYVLRVLSLAIWLDEFKEFYNENV